MSFVSIIRDYVEMLNQLSNSLGTDFTFKTFFLESFFYLLQTVKVTIFYIFSFQWIRDFSLLPTIIPSISSSIFRETFFLETPSKIFFEFLEIPSLDQNKILLGFFNSFFFTLPLSIIHIISVRRLIIQGIPAGVFSISGYLLGQFLFLICVIFGIRAISIPWLTFEPLNYIIGLILIFRIIYSMVQEPLVNLTGSDWKSPKYQNFFLTSFALAWCEQTSIFQYLGNISITSNPTLLEGFSTNSTITSFLSHTNYLVGILIGSIFFTGLWGFLFLKLRDLIFSYTPLFTSSFMQLLNKATFILALGFSLSSIPYYGIDYLFMGPLGFISQDQIFKNTILAQYNVKDSSQYLGSTSNFQSLDMDIAPFDRGRYLIFPDIPQLLSFEDLNYQGEAEWTTRIDKLAGITDSKGGFFALSKILKPKKVAPVQNSVEEFKQFENVNSLIPESQGDWGFDNSSREERFLEYKVLPKKSDEISLESMFQEFSDLSFSTDFLRPESLVEKDIEKKIKQKYYSNPIYKNLLTLDIDLFLNRQPVTSRLSNAQELDLYTKRCILNSYYDSLRAYSKLPYREEFEDFFDGSKSFSNKVYNQQFKGTLRSVKRLFALTVDTNSEEIKSSHDKPQVLKYDQPLYNFSSSEKFSPYHEELADFKNSQERNMGNQLPFIQDPLTRPLYAGWDENLRKFVITNKLLPRKVAGYRINLNSEILPKIDPDSKNSLFTKANKKSSNLISQKIKFTAWPLSKEQLEQTNSPTKIPYVTLFVQNEEGSDYRQLVPTVPANWETLKRIRLEKPLEKSSQIGDNLFDYLAPKKGGFIWPGNSMWDFSFLSKE